MCLLIIRALATHRLTLAQATRTYTNAHHLMRMHKYQTQTAAIAMQQEFSHMPTFYLPADTVHHAGTIMAWPTEASILDSDDGYGSSPGIVVDETKAELAALALTIAKYEPLHIFVNNSTTFPANGDNTATNDEDLQLLQETPNITIHRTQNVHSLWARDTGPLFIFSEEAHIENCWPKGADPGIGFTTKNTSSELVGMLLNYNQWGRKQTPTPDMYLAALACERFNVSSYRAPFTGEGGAIEVDGHGTMLATESSILNPNRNPGINKEVMEQYFGIAFGVTKTIWLPGTAGADITDDHVDGLARFGSPGVVLLNRPHVAANSSLPNKAMAAYEEVKAIISTATDANGNELRIVDVLQPDPAKVLGKDYRVEDGPSVSFVNFYTVNGAVIIPSFGDAALDDDAARIIGKQFPGRVVEQVYLHQLALQGGGIHCATQQIPSRGKHGR